MYRFTVNYIKRFRLYVCITAFCMLLHACALQIPPTGGAKDVTPPKILKAIPANGNTNFKDSKILLNFDENVELNNPNTEVIITPPLAHPAAYKLKKRTLIIDFKDNVLKPNTTYTILLGNAIKDLHEGNKLGGYNYVFSTGAYIDSFSMDGKVFDALTHKEFVGAKILLYAGFNDSAIIKSKPDYYAVSSGGGEFHVEHLKKDTFRVYALNDKNGNLQYDLGEDIAFIPQRQVTQYKYKAGTAAKKKDSFRINQIHQSIALRMFTQKTEKSVLKSCTQTAPYLILKFGKVPNTLNISSLMPKSSPNYVGKSYIPLKYKVLKYLDSVQVWYPVFGDTPSITNNYKVYANNTWLETHGDTMLFPLHINFDSLSIDTILKLKTQSAKDAFKFQFKVEASAALTDKYGYPLVLNFNLPIKDIDLNKVLVLPPNSKKSTLRRSQFIDSSHTQLLLDAELDPDTMTKIRIMPGAFKTIYGNRNDTIKTAVLSLQQRNYGHLSMIINAPSGDYFNILQLVDKDQKVYFEKLIEASEKIDLPFVDPNTYKVRVIKDSNHNKRWDTGNIFKKILPEEVYYYPNDIIVKANWDILDVHIGVTY